MRNRKFFVLPLILLLVLSLAACGQQPAQQPAPQPAQPSQPAPSAGDALAPLNPPVHIKIAEDGSPSGAGFYIAEAKGYFADLGITIEFVEFESSADMLPALAAGHVDIAGGITSTALFNAVDRGLDIKIIADKGTNNPGRSYYTLTIRNDLVDEVKDYADLRGRKIGLFSLGTLNELTVEKALKKGGLTVDDVELIPMGPRDMTVALSTGAIDLGMHIEPGITAGVKEGHFQRWKDTTDFAPGAQIAVTLASPHLVVGDKQEVGKRFMVAYLKALRDYNDAFVKGINRDEIIAIMAQYTDIKDIEVWQDVYVTGLNPNGYVNKDGVAADLAWYKDHGHYTGNVDLNSMIDHSLVDFAIGILGEYK